MHWRTALCHTDTTPVVSRLPGPQVGLSPNHGCSKLGPNSHTQLPLW